MILIAGGVGNRLGAGIPKQFVEVLGKPVIAYTMSVLQNCSEIDRIEVVCVDGYQDKLQKIVDDNNISKVFKIVTGGKEYENSIMNGVTGLAGIAKNEDVIMVQWAASPFVTDEILKDNIRVCKEKGNAMSACPAYLLYGSNDGKQANHLHVRVSDSSTKVVFIKDTPNSKYYRGGLWIDVFPIDNVSDKKDGFIKHVILVKIFTGLQMIGDIGGWDLVRRVMHIPMKPSTPISPAVRTSHSTRWNSTSALPTV